MNISVIVPTYNSELFIEKTLLSLISNLESAKLTYEIIIVDDASVDSTYTILSKFNSDRPNIRLLKNLQNSGQHKSTFNGIAVAEGDYILSIDDDLEYSPADIIFLFEFIQRNNYDLVYGVPSKIKSGIRNHILYNIYFLLLQMGKEKRKTSFRIFKRDLIKPLLQYYDRSPFILDFYLNRIALNVGYTIVDYKPITHSRYTLYAYLLLIKDNMRLKLGKL